MAKALERIMRETWEEAFEIPSMSFYLIHRQRPIVVAVIVARAKHHPSLDRDVCVPKDLPGQRFRVSTLAFISLTFRTLRYIGGNEEKNNRRTLPQQWLFDERQIRRWNPHRKASEAGKDIPREFRARRRNICQAVAAYN
ncbi:hypothetical protein V1477_005557 [Vespula maculifrons]|uniref:Uncharacterized protein n=1 Tax=Vespula maculifrons TaxID=7453 RepID=A0ABD2CQ20_VESMC